MTPLRLAIALTSLIVSAGIAKADSFSPRLSARDPGVERWISYEILGPRNHPFPFVYLSTQHFTTEVGEFLIVLPSARYGVISAYTQARIARPDCPGEEPRGNVWYTVKIAEHHEKHTQSCVLPQALACDYLSGVLKLSGVNLTATERRPITNFMAEVKCDTGRIDDVK